MSVFEFELSCLVRNKTLTEVWQRVESWEGVNAELGPWIKMTAPDRFPTVSTIPADGVSHFTSYFLLLGVLPIDAHRLAMLVVDPPNTFHEQSSNLMISRWTHIRRLQETDEGVQVTDYCEIQPRLRLTGRLLHAVYLQVFRRRHRRLVRFFAR